MTDEQTPYLDIKISAWKDGAAEVIADARVNVDDTTVSLAAVHDLHEGVINAALARGAKVHIVVTDPDGLLPPVEGDIGADGFIANVTGMDDDAADLTSQAAVLFVRAIQEHDDALGRFVETVMASAPGAVIAGVVRSWVHLLVLGLAGGREQPLGYLGGPLRMLVASSEAEVKQAVADIEAMGGDASLIKPAETEDGELIVPDAPPSVRLTMNVIHFVVTGRTYRVEELLGATDVKTIAQSLGMLAKMAADVTPSLRPPIVALVEAEMRKN